MYLFYSHYLQDYAVTPCRECWLRYHLADNVIVPENGKGLCYQDLMASGCDADILRQIRNPYFAFNVNLAFDSITAVLNHHFQDRNLAYIDIHEIITDDDTIRNCNGAFHVPNAEKYQHRIWHLDADLMVHIANMETSKRLHPAVPVVMCLDRRDMEIYHAARYYGIIDEMAIERYFLDHFDKYQYDNYEYGLEFVSRNQHQLPTVVTVLTICRYFNKNKVSVTNLEYLADRLDLYAVASCCAPILKSMLPFVTEVEILNSMKLYGWYITDEIFSRNNIALDHWPIIEWLQHEGVSDAALAKTYAMACQNSNSDLVQKLHHRMTYQTQAEVIVDVARTPYTVDIMNWLLENHTLSSETVDKIMACYWTQYFNLECLQRFWPYKIDSQTMQRCRLKQNIRLAFHQDDKDDQDSTLTFDIKTAFQFLMDGRIETQDLIDVLHHKNFDWNQTLDKGYVASNWKIAAHDAIFDLAPDLTDITLPEYLIFRCYPKETVMHLLTTIDKTGQTLERSRWRQYFQPKPNSQYSCYANHDCCYLENLWLEFRKIGGGNIMELILMMGTNGCFSEPMQATASDLTT